ncbi:U1 small nuclear ribonucleoprotein A [Golovinomyces cichoracearum]|uniref:U1 small nuclear ribonucleoprotein A n=1 Tax=Golovinomyces cichoracearum TaxID=62708 RepID=A0A420HI89_9PEZI|nr:U1 small nuclear ribonucleoprotein A [Golovinomyces cichoracearum]
MSVEKQNGQVLGAGKASNIAPNQTLYITNIPSSKYQKEDLRRSLYILFSTYGTVLDVVALLTSKMRGQAHIVFRDVQTATLAMRELQGFEFFGKEMRIQYAKSKSDIIARLDGTSRTSNAGAVGVVSTELQQSIFNTLPSITASLPPKPPGSINVKTEDIPMGKSRVPAPSVAGQKRDRDEDEDPVEDSESDVAMEEDSDDD